MKCRSALPGFSLSVGLTIFWVSAIVLIPITAVFIRSFGDGWEHFLSAAFSERALAAYRVTFGASAAATAINAVFGLLIAWVLVRFEFPGRRLLSAAVDLPFALPTAVAGIALTAIYANTGWIGSILEPMGVPIAYRPQGIVVALAFIGLPFVVRAVEPVL
ncbi:MAG: sulfate ABC transporter permease subunit CysT, partial [Sphingobium sp.]